MRRWCTFLFFALLTGGVFAGEAAPLAADEAVEKRLVAISEELRCLVCQNESIAGSQADLANDLRREIRKMIGEGKTDREILDFMVARYGDFVRYRPPVKPSTWALWGGPFILLAGGLGAWRRRLSFLKNNVAMRRHCWINPTHEFIFYRGGGTDPGRPGVAAAPVVARDR